MSKKMLTKNTKKYKPKRIANIFDEAGEIERSKFTQNSINAAKEAFSGSNLGSSLGAIGSGVGSIVTSALSNAEVDTTTADNAIDAINNFKPSFGSLDALAESYNNTVFTDTDYDYKDFMVSTGKALGNMGKATLSGATAGATVGGPWGAVAGAAAGLLGSSAGWLAGRLKAENEAERLTIDSRFANLSANSRAEAARDSILEESQRDFLRNLAAKGGKINTMKDNVFNNSLMHQHGGVFSNGVIIIDNGGTHEDNPFEGVQIGIDTQGIPNLVEEGEVIWQDYVFSNRLNPSEEFKKKYKVKGETFADIAKEMQKESAERPNDPISKRGLEDSMIRLMSEQENIRMKNNKRQNTNKFPDGGFKVPFMHNGKTISDYEFNQRLKDGTAQVDDKYKKNTINPGFLRYAPVLGSALGVISDIAGITNKPDYTNVNLIKEATDRIAPIEFKPIETKLTYTPFDTQFYASKLAEQAAATKRAIQESAPTAGAAIAGLLNADFNAQTKLGDLYRQAEEYNQALKERVYGFNRQTDAINSEGLLKAAMANQKSDEMRIKSAMTQAQMRDQIESIASSAKSANLTGLFDNLGAVGKESFIMNMIENIPSLLYDYMGRYKNSSAKGGKINRKRRK